MLISEPRQSYARTPSNPFHALQPASPQLDHVASAVALVLLLASWAVAYVALVPADPAPAHRFHVTAQR